MIRQRTKSLEPILDKLGRHSLLPDGGVLAHCPAHSDSNPSLVVSLTDDGRLLLHCRAHCPFESVKEALGIDNLNGWAWPDVLSERMDGLGPKRRTPEPSASMGKALRRQLSKWGLSGSVLKYAKDRFGLTSNQAEKLGLVLSPAGCSGADFLGGAWTSVPRMVVPFHSFTGRTIGAQARYICSDSEAAGAPRWAHLSNVDDSYGWGRYGVFYGDPKSDLVFITEGPSDAITIYAADLNAVAIAGTPGRSKELAETLQNGLRGKRVVVVGDADKAGQNFSRAVCKILPNAVVIRPLSGAGDVNESFSMNRVAWRQRMEREAYAMLSEAVSLDETLGYWADWAPRPGNRSHNWIAREFLSWVRDRGLWVYNVEGSGLAVFDGRLYDLDRDRIATLLYEFGESAHQAKEAGVEPTKDLGKLSSVENTPQLESVLRALRARVHKINQDDLDHDPDILSVANGVVKLKTGMLVEPERDMLLSYALPHVYRPEAECPKWERFVLEVMDGDEERASYLQRLLGYALTGRTDEQCLAFFYGKGANGKSVAQNVVSHVFGPICSQVNYHSLTQSLGGGPQPEVMKLRGSRLTFVPEASNAAKLEDSTVKLLTGGDAIMARSLYKDSAEFVPRHLIVMTTNHMPEFADGSSYSILRRVKLIPFNRTFEKHEQNPNLERELKEEAEGILAWLVEGAKEWYKHGLMEPESITESTRKVHAYSDPFVGFIPGIVQPDEDAKATPTLELYQLFEEWRRTATTAKKKSLSWFSEELESRGYRTSINADGNFIVDGLSVRGNLHNKGT